MLANLSPAYLLASADPALLAALEPALSASGASVEVVLSADSALAAMTAPTAPVLALLDAHLPGMPIARLLAAVRAQDSTRNMAIVLFMDTLTPEASDRLAEGVIDDILLRADEQAYWQLRLNAALRARRQLRELEELRENAVFHVQMDPITGLYNRQTLLSMLFRETDRVQRLSSSLCMVLYDIDDFGHWNERLGAESCDSLLRQSAARTARLLRSYDLLGRAGKDEFLAGLPGCSPVNAVLLAERIRLEVFAAPYRIDGRSIRLSACFGISASHGRSPVVVLREAEQALAIAKQNGPESIQCFNASEFPEPAPVMFLAESSGEEIVAW
jgi:diguanylate cyclase (GGDEF)-like protein